MQELAERLLANLWIQTNDYACALLNPEGVIIGWRGAAESIFGYAEEEIQGKSIALIFTEEDERLRLPGLERGIAATNGRAEDDRWHVRKDGARIWISGALLAIRAQDRDGDGEVIGFAKVMRDRTDLKTQIEALQNQNQELERTLIAHEHSFSRITHEIRNSLAPLSNALELVRLAQGANARFPADVAKRQLAILERMAADLMEVARLKAGKLRLAKQLFDVGSELQQIVTTLKPRALEKQQEIMLLLPGPPISIWADRERIHQVVFNLLDNALKYTDKGGHVWLKCMIEGDTLILKVEDDGIGIPADLLPRIFQLFTQEAPEHSAGGIGVGLSLVKELVEAHGGVMEVRSDGRGKGQRVHCALTVSGRAELAMYLISLHLPKKARLLAPSWSTT